MAAQFDRETAVWAQERKRYFVHIILKLISSNAYYLRALSVGHIVILTVDRLNTQILVL